MIHVFWVCFLGACFLQEFKFQISFGVFLIYLELSIGVGLGSTHDLALKFRLVFSAGFMISLAFGNVGVGSIVFGPLDDHGNLVVWL